MTTAAIKHHIKKTLRGILTFFAPLFSRKSTMDMATARENLLRCSPMPKGTANAENRVLEPICDLQIVIPAYNVEPYLDDCMESVLAQKTKYDFRVILVDDGSTDRTPDIADKYADHERVTVIHQENRGLSGARNTGMAEIIGKYILFVDSDDILCEGAVEAMLDTAFACNSDMVEGGAYYLIDGKTTIMHRYDCVKTIPNPYDVFHGHAWGKVFKAKIFENLCFPEGFWYEDSLLSFLIFPNLKNACVIPHICYSYRVNPSGIVKSSHGKPKSVDTYWITELLMESHARAGLPADDAYFAYILLQIRLNQHRVADLSSEIQESIFVLSCELVQRYFPAGIIDGSHAGLAKALKNKDFGAFKMCCKLF